MASVTLEQLVKDYQDSRHKTVRAVNSINLEIRDREFMVLVGPSGCGKTTTLRMIAGLEDISSGQVRIGDTVVNHIPPKNRDIAMVFQNYALYPHMTVYENMAFGLTLQKVPREQIRQRVQEAAEILGIQSLLDRKPKALSGGQRQRVAVGRAIVRKPKVFLFDEPLSNLDAKMRVSMRTEISKLHARLASTMIYVTHDQVEAMTMGDRITVMKDGNIMQVAEPLELYNHPNNLFVAGFIGSPPMNFFRGRIEQEGPICWFVEDNQQGTPLRVALSDGLSRIASSYGQRPVVFGLRPEDIREARQVTARPMHTVQAKVEVSEPMGAETYIYLDTGAHSFIARVRSSDRYDIGADLRLVFDVEKAHLFDPVTEMRLR